MSVTQEFTCMFSWCRCWLTNQFVQLEIDGSKMEMYLRWKRVLALNRRQLNVVLVSLHWMCDGSFYVLSAHPESSFQLDLAVCSRALQREALVHSHVGDVEKAVQGQVENTQRSLLLLLFDLDHGNTNKTIRAVNGKMFYTSWGYLTDKVVSIRLSSVGAIHTDTYKFIGIYTKK